MRNHAKIFTFTLLSLLSISGIPMKKRTAFAQGEISKAECVMELNSRRVLYEERGDTRLPMASTTKIVTAATVLSQCKNIKEEVFIPKEAEGVEGSSVYLKEGDVYTVEDLLYGLMLRSGNDCATALAYHFAGSIPSFSSAMNQTALKAGALQSAFKNPHGLPCNGHYTTARDLTGIACYAMQNEIFRKIVSTKYYEPRGWKNKNKLLYQFEGAVGIKTGYTKEAGRCLVSAASKNGMTLVCTVLHCGPMYERSAKLLNDAFSAYCYQPLVQKGEAFTVAQNKNGYSKEAFSYPLTSGEEDLLAYEVKEVEKCENLKNAEEIVGQLKIYLAKQLLFSTNLYKL